MDDPRFDHLTREIGRRGWTRRGLARLLSGAALVGLSAAKAPAKRRKPKPKKCKNGLVKCGKTCVNTQTNALHCGGCGIPCDAGETCVEGQCNLSGCGAGQIDCGGGACIPNHEHACCSFADCGPFSSFNEIVCDLNLNRCVCNPDGPRASWGICQRFSDKSGLCGPCCPGGNGACAGEAVCLNQTISGCGCPPSAPQGCPGGFCSRDQQTDSTRCGPFCEDCTRGGTAFACCVNGQCVGLAGCAPGTSSPSCTGAQCGSCGAICGGDAYVCCNNGPGTTGQCKIPLSGGSCPPPGR